MRENHFNCIYMYTNKINGKRYVGQAVNFKQRHNQHKSSSYNKKNKYQYNLPFHNAIRKYGIENFKINILAEDIPTQEKMNEYEIFFIKRYDTLCKNGKGYNIASGGSNGNKFAGKTEEEMEEIKQKKSEAMKGKKHSKEARQKMSKAHKGENNPNYGKHLSEETKQKISEAQKGKKHTEEHKQKISENHADFSGENHPMYGKKHSEETKQKMSDSWTEERKQKLSEANSIKIVQYNKETYELIRIWDSAIDIKRELGINNGNIISCCKGKRKSAGGFIFKYYKE